MAHGVFIMRLFFLTLACAVFPFAAWAIEAPSGQTHIDANSVLRGRFVEERQMGDGIGSLHLSGRFVVAPAHGLIWVVEKPFPTATIITPNGAAQDVGGIAIKLRMKNLQHLYDVIGRALAGDWNGLETDFVITSNSNATDHWKVLMTPRSGDKPKLPYASITVSGSRFVENIIMTKVTGNSDELNFTEEIFSAAQLTADEIATFNEIRR